MVKLTVFKEKIDSFRYPVDRVEVSELTPGPRSFWDNEEKTIKCLIELSSILNVCSGSRCLEVGAGHNPFPSQSLARLAKSVTTLDADWEDERHPNISFDKYKQMEETLGKGIVIPRFAGTTGLVNGYLGDVAFINHKKSELRHTLFDLIYFWGVYSKYWILQFYFSV